MASETEKLNGKLEGDDNPLANYDFHINKKLRDAGLQYISRTGKTIAAKEQPDELCNCPQRCGDKIPMDVRKYLFTEFYKMGDHVQQNTFLQKYIEMRSVRKRLWDDDEQRVDGRLQRRVSCKYHVPTEIPKDEKPTDNAQNNSRKLIKSKINAVEVCQKAFMNVYAITEKRIRLQREKLISKSRTDAGMPSPNGSESTPAVWTQDTIIMEIGPLLMDREIWNNLSLFENPAALPTDVPTKILDAVNTDINTVDNFFFNQLWKPEYTDCGLEKPPSYSGENRFDYYKLLKMRNEKTNGDTSPLNNNVTKTVSPDKPVAIFPTKGIVHNNTTPSPVSNNKVIDFSTMRTLKNINVDSRTPVTPKNTRNSDSTSKTTTSGNSKSKPESKFMSFENSSISITPVNNNKNVSNSTSSSSSIYNSINFGNSSISITPLYRQ